MVEENSGEVTLKHPNTDWLLIFHEGGTQAPDKPLRNHYGVRVATNGEIEKADAYLEKMKDQYQIEIMKPRNHHFARSVHFFEPGGNWWEIESYELAVKAGMGENVLPHWKSLLPEEKFPGRGYVPQALSHGTMECYDLDRSRQFYREVLGLEVVAPSPSAKPHYVKHPATPWYIVSLQVPLSEKKILGPHQRFTLAPRIRTGGGRSAALAEGVRQGSRDHRAHGNLRSERRGFVYVKRSGQQLVGNRQPAAMNSQLELGHGKNFRRSAGSDAACCRFPSRHSPRERIV